MEIEKNISKSVLRALLKDPSMHHTITSLARELKMSRVGMWKVLKKLERKRYINLNPIGSGKTSTYTISLNWESTLMEKALALYLAEEAMEQRRWQADFAELGSKTDFLILYGSILHSPKQAHDIDIIGVARKDKFTPIQKALDTIQRTADRKIHAVHFTEKEFRKELQKPNEAFIAAVKKGVVLFGQESFIRIMRKIHG
ncbi:MAG TPA: hypothetical protein VJB08_06120 [Candidatus Nanoarchaeia archaeon]|nr:hypothetical protein [Candidatus Nanoarchaeia archaeon]